MVRGCGGGAVLYLLITDSEENQTMRQMKDVIKDVTKVVAFVENNLKPPPVKSSVV